MPEICRFYGISVLMYYNDHAPPHIHARLGEFEARVDILTGRLISGALPQRAGQRLVEWIELKRDELLENWELARSRKLLRRIEPLK